MKIDSVRIGAYKVGIANFFRDLFAKRNEFSD